jgi:hypothetical protein
MRSSSTFLPFAFATPLLSDVAVLGREANNNTKSAGAVLANPSAHILPTDGVLVLLGRGPGKAAGTRVSSKVLQGSARIRAAPGSLDPLDVVRRAKMAAGLRDGADGGFDVVIGAAKGNFRRFQPQPRREASDCAS